MAIVTGIYEIPTISPVMESAIPASLLWLVTHTDELDLIKVAIEKYAEQLTTEGFWPQLLVRVTQSRAWLRDTTSCLPVLELIDTYLPADSKLSIYRNVLTFDTVFLPHRYSHDDEIGTDEKINDVLQFFLIRVEIETMDSSSLLALAARTPLPFVYDWRVVGAALELSGASILETAIAAPTPIANVLLRHYRALEMDVAMREKEIQTALQYHSDYCISDECRHESHLQCFATFGIVLDEPTLVALLRTRKVGVTLAIVTLAKSIPVSVPRRRQLLAGYLRGIHSFERTVRRMHAIRTEQDIHYRRLVALLLADMRPVGVQLMERAAPIPNCSICFHELGTYFYQCRLGQWNDHVVCFMCSLKMASADRSLDGGQSTKCPQCKQDSLVVCTKKAEGLTVS